MLMCSIICMTWKLVIKTYDEDVTHIMNGVTDRQKTVFLDTLDQKKDFVPLTKTVDGKVRHMFIAVDTIEELYFEREEPQNIDDMEDEDEDVQYNVFNDTQIYPLNHLGDTPKPLYYKK